MNLYNCLKEVPVDELPNQLLVLADAVEESYQGIPGDQKKSRMMRRCARKLEAWQNAGVVKELSESGIITLHCWTSEMIRISVSGSIRIVYDNIPF